MNKVLFQRERRAKRTRARLISDKGLPRLSVYRSSKHIYVQLIDDQKHKTLVAADDLKLTQSKLSKKNRAKKVGGDIANKIIGLKIKQVVFDRGYYKYTGRIKYLATAVREAGVKI